MQTVETNRPVIFKTGHMQASKYCIHTADALTFINSWESITNDFITIIGLVFISRKHL